MVVSEAVAGAVRRAPQARCSLNRGAPERVSHHFRLGQAAASLAFEVSQAPFELAPNRPSVGRAEWTPSKTYVHARRVHQYLVLGPPDCVTVWPQVPQRHAPYAPCASRSFHQHTRGMEVRREDTSPPHTAVRPTEHDAATRPSEGGWDRHHVLRGGQEILRVDTVDASIAVFEDDDGSEVAEHDPHMQLAVEHPTDVHASASEHRE